MSQDNIGRAKKSSRLNSKKQDKVQLFIDKSWNHQSVDIIIHYEQKIGDSPKIIRGLNLYKNQNNQFIGYLFADYLKTSQFCKQQNSVSFWDESKRSYIFGFNIPKQVKQIKKNIAYRFVNEKSIQIKIRSKRKMIVESLIEQQRIKYDQDDATNKNKQKKIGEVVQKVALWRKFYTGFYDQFGNYIQKPLQTAAQQVGIAKKTLDDYLLQIRNGKKYGFNFNQKVNAKIGQLRAFVRDEKKKEQK